jgi:hypothetical protein
MRILTDFTAKRSCRFELLGRARMRSQPLGGTLLGLGLFVSGDVRAHQLAAGGILILL